MSLFRSVSGYVGLWGASFFSGVFLSLVSDLPTDCRSPASLQRISKLRRTSGCPPFPSAGCRVHSTVNLHPGYTGVFRRFAFSISMAYLGVWISQLVVPFLRSWYHCEFHGYPYFTTPRRGYVSVLLSRTTNKTSHPRRKYTFF